MPPTWEFKVKSKLKPTGIVKKYIVMQNATVREYTRRCNTVEDIHIHKVIGLCDRVIFIQETEAINIRKVPLVSSPKQVI